MTTLRQRWWRATHFNSHIVYDPPLHVQGSYFSVSGMMVTSQRRWYKTAMRVLWGVDFQKRTGLGKMKWQ